MRDARAGRQAGTTFDTDAHTRGSTSPAGVVCARWPTALPPTTLDAYQRELPPRVAGLIGENHSPAPRPTMGEAMRTTLEATKG
jgi:hypothetical protein